MPRYAFRCPTCALAFEVERRMDEASRPAACPEDGAAAERVFTAPGLLRGATAAGSASPSPARRYWASPFFPRDRAAPPPAGAAPAPKHVLPPGSSKPASFRHFGHWHPADTPAHSHRAPRASRPKRGPSKG